MGDKEIKSEEYEALCKVKDDALAEVSSKNMEISRLNTKIVTLEKQNERLLIKTFLKDKLVLLMAFLTLSIFMDINKKR